MAKPLTEKLRIKENAEKFKEKLKKIKICLFDIDGILTDGSITWGGEEVGFNRTYNILDGHGFKLLRAAGIKVGVISGGDGPGMKRRFNETLKLDFVFLGNEDKRLAYKTILAQVGCTDEEVLYMGDEFIDLAILSRVGFSATVPNASYEIQEVVDYITHREAGDACAREVMDMLRYAQDLHVLVLEF
jgi:3-deoxy-D-manno-octulosonate 8-phosphate phosphatase (KDO 8-P phosphatase)